MYVTLVRSFHRAQDIARVAGGGDAEQHVARLADAADLFGEYLIEVIVVADRGERRGVGRERHRRERRALALVAAGELGGGGVRGRRPNPRSPGHGLSAPPPPPQPLYPPP